jgi:hypothetical protein
LREQSKDKNIMRKSMRYWESREEKCLEIAREIINEAICEEATFSAIHFSSLLSKL